MLPFRPQAVVFDLDGVLVDSEDVWARAEARTVEELGGSYGREVAELLYGRGHRDGGRLLAERFGGDADAIGERLLDLALAGMREGLRPLPGAVELVTSLRGRVPIAVASNSVRAIVETALAAAGLAASFDAVVCGEDVERAKPAPDAYLAACGALGADPTRTVALDDSPVGVASAKAAGLFTIGVDSGRGVPLPDADVVLSSLAELDLAA
jgi:HAD superfamily hydrolase (TIGR01509 family)